jgi:poly-gamma-glutamate biosynthesis protein PgsC/CapC
MPLAESIAVGLVLGFFFYEWLGLTAGGFVVPGYIALYLNRPGVLAATLAASLATFGLVHLASRWCIIYGRRRFMLMLLVGFAMQSLAGWAAGRLPWLGVPIDVIGYIIPGLIANELERQGVVRTLAGLTILSVLVRLVLVAFGLLEVW